MGCSLSLFAQFVPQGFNYQSIVRDADGQPLANQTVTLLLTIRSGAPNGPVAYSEKQVVSTNEFGLINLVIGQNGTQLSIDPFTAVNWSGGAKFLTVSVETSPNVFDELGTSELMSVPYAMYALSSGSGGGGGGDNWGNQTVATGSTLSGNGTAASPLELADQGAVPGQVLKWDGANWTPQNDVVGQGPGGGITEINTGPGLTGGPITSSGTIALSSTGVTPGVYGSTSQIPVITVDAQGRIASVFTTVVSPGGDTNPNDDITVNSQADGDVSGPFSNLQIKADAVGSAEIAADAVGSAEIAAGAVGAPEILDNAVTSAKIAANAVGSAEIAPDAVGTSEISDDAVGSDEIATGAVGTSEIANGAVTGAKIAAGTITADKLDDMGADAGEVL
jgi:hypothetical protein